MVQQLRRMFIACLVMVVMVCAHKGEDVASWATGEGAPPVIFQASVQPKEVSLGDIITFSLRVSKLPNVSSEPPEFRPVVDGLSFIESGRTGPDQEGGRMVESRWYRFRAEQAGTLSFPGVKMTYTLGGKTQDLQTEEIFVQVESVLPKEMKDIRDLKPLERPRRDLHVLFYAGAAVLLFALLALVVWLHVRSQRRRGAVPSQIVPAHEEAEEALKKLESMGLIEKGEVKRYYFILSEIFRRYLERRFRIKAVERTTEEILKEIPALKIGEEEKRDLRSFLLNADPVKFAGRVPSREEVDQETAKVREFIRRTFLEQAAQGEEVAHVAV